MQPVRALPFHLYVEPWRDRSTDWEYRQPGAFLQIFSGLLGGAIVDKYGRRLTLLIFDLLCWSVPCLIWAVELYGLIPAVQGLFLFGFVALTAKFVVLYLYSHETARGVQCMAETRHRSLAGLLGEYKSVFHQLLHSRPILAALSLMMITNIYITISNSFVIQDVKV